MINKRIVIAILARDCNMSLIRNIPRIEELRSKFAASMVVVVENDSKDGTKETLHDWATQSKGIDLIMNDFGSVTIPEASANNPNPSTSMHRIEKMARYRNMYMDYVRSLEHQPDYLIVIDVDVESFSVDGIINSIENAPQGWGALFANGQRFYRDRFPYFFDLYAYLPTRCEAEPDRKNDELFYESKRITHRLCCEEYVDCLSAFSGLGIYKWPIVKELHYEAMPNNRSRTFEAICEHVPFNLEVCRMGFHNYVCRAMNVNYGSRSLKHLLIYSMLPTKAYTTLYRILKGTHYAD